MTKESMVRPRVFLDIGIDQVEAGRIVVELFSDVCPRTCENFRCLCTGEKGIGSSTGKALHYKNVVFHRVIHGFMLQAGDFSEGNGRGGESIYGGYFEDESFDLKHDKPFLLSMANRGVNTNGSQFFITTQTTPHLNGKHVVFGRVVSGENVVKQVESQKTDANNRPLKECKIVHCGELVLAKSKKKHKKHKLSTDGSAASTDDDELSGGEKKKKKIKRKHKHKKEKKHKKKHKQEQEAQATAIKNKENEADDEIIGSISSIKPEEIPEVPENRFLGRFNSKEKERLDEERTVTNASTGDSRQWTTRSGRKIKGRGALRYRTPSRSRSRSMSPRSGRRTHSSRLHSASSSSRRANDTARKGSETPPHWRDAQERRSQRSLRERLNEYGDSEDDAAEGNERWKKNSPGVRARRRARSGADGDCMKSHNGGYKGRNNRGKGSNDDDDDDDGHKATLRDVPRQHSSSDNSGDDLENTNVKKRKRLSTGGRHSAKDDEQDNRRDCSHDAQKQTSSSAQHNSSKDDRKRQRRSRHNQDSSDEVTEDQLDLTSGKRNIQADNESKQSRKHLDEKTNRRSDHHESPRGHRNSTGNRNHSPRDHRGLAQDKHGSPIHHHDSSGDLRKIKDSMKLEQKSSDSSSDESNSVNNRNMTQTVESYPINATDCSKSPEPNHSISASAATKKLKKIDSTACHHDSSNDSDNSDDINFRDMVKTSGSNSKEHNNDRTLVSTHKVISTRDMCKLSNETKPDSRDHRHRGSSSEHSDSITAHHGSHESTLLSNKSTKCSDTVKASPDSLNECNDSRSDHSDSDGSSKNKSPTKTYKKLSVGNDDSSGSYDSTKGSNKLTYLKKQEASKVVQPPGNFGESYNDFKSPEKENCSDTSPVNRKQGSAMSTKADLDTNSSLDQGEKQQSTKNRTDSIGDCNVITSGSSNQQSHHSREDKLLAGANSGKDAATAELSASQKEILDKYIPTSDAVESSHVKEESVNVPNEAKIANFGALGPESVNISQSSVILSNSIAPLHEGKNHNCEKSEVSKDNAEDRSEKPTQTIIDAISGGNQKGLSEIKSNEGDASGMSQDIATMESIQEETITLNVTEETMEVVKAQENILQQPAILKHESQDKEPDKSDLDSNRSSSSSPIRKKPADDSSDTSPTKQRKSSHRSRSRDRKRSKSRDRKRSKSRERKRAKSRDRRRSRSRNRKRSTSRDRKRSKSRDRKRSRSRDLRRNRMRSRSRDRRRSRSPDRRRISSRDRKRSRSRSLERRRARRSRSRDRRHSRRRSRSRSKRRSRSRSRRRSRSRSRRRTPLASAYRRDRRRSSDRYRRSRSRNRSPRSKRRRTRSRSRSAARRRRLRESARRRSSPSRSHSRGSGERKSARRRSASVKKKPERANSTSSSSSEERAKAAVRRKNAIKRKISRSSSTSSSSGSDSSD